MNPKDITNSGTTLVIFFSDLVAYLSFRLRQIGVWTILLFELVTIGASNLKRAIIRRMFWGRTSFYRKLYHVSIISITIVTLLSGIVSRITGIQNIELGINATSNEIYSADMAVQYANAKSFTIRSGDELPFDVYEHTVTKGETLKDIARLYNLENPDSIKWANGLDPYSNLIKPGQKLKIPPMNGVMIISKESETPRALLKGIKLPSDVNLYDVLELNNFKSIDERLPAGRVIFIPNGSKVPPPPKGAPVRGGAVYVEFSDLGIELSPGTFTNPLGDESCDGYSFIRGWYIRGFLGDHTGVDLAKSGGCWIRAVGSGVVKKAAWLPGRLGYGVVIDHQNGLQTLYAHGNGVFAVREGQKVKAGQKIMYMGSTGNASGVHLHLSVASSKDDIINCYTCRFNPKNLIPY